MKQYTDLIKGICKMLEVIDKSKKARQFAYTFLFLAFIFGIRPADLWQPSNRTL